MTNEEAIEELKRIDTDLLKTADCGNKTSECMAAGRGRKAMRLAIKALENKDKYEKALKMTCEKIAASVDVDCYKIECDKGGDCIRCAIEYYKREAGIDS